MKIRKIVCMSLCMLLFGGCSDQTNTQTSETRQEKSPETQETQSSQTVSSDQTISGTVSEPITIDTDEAVTLTLDNASLESIDIQNAKEVTIVLKGSSTIHETSIGTLTSEDADVANAAIYATCPLTFKGEGLLSIDARSNHGIYSNDTITIESGTYNITCVNDGIKGKDGVTISDGTISITSQDHGIASTKNKDGIYGEIEIDGGTIELNCQGDGIHSSGSVVINGGEIQIDSEQEGIEGQTVTLNNGSAVISAKDDGINASDPNATSSMDPMAGASSNCSIAINGGQYTITADGDGLDSNGSLEVHGGTTFVFGPESGGDFALDFDGSGTFDGGTLIATGYSGMVETLQSDVPYLALQTSTDGAIELKVNDSVLLSCKPTHSYDTVLVYDESLKEGDEVEILNEQLTLSSGANGNLSTMQRPQNQPRDDGFQRGFPRK